ncbi:hypothetical protein C7S16_1616 [Burkholderia thailandensis]|uniref:Uncharacterized protein n=1 Tax=Burkholderia thailandensis TaxID=57975 RepID=A0AAW9CU93_BURTH|nr:hypothetical protein [Burkholderia thailandensis]MDW9254530.1 hypothetical protein [Burkholderia thailandensis]
MQRFDPAARPLETLRKVANFDHVKNGGTAQPDVPGFAVGRRRI